MSIDTVFMLIAFTSLAVVLAVTRKHDSLCWWFFRLLMTYSLICFVWKAIGSTDINNTAFVFLIRIGDMALALAMLLFAWLKHRTLPPLTPPRQGKEG